MASQQSPTLQPAGSGGTGSQGSPPGNLSPSGGAKVRLHQRLLLRLPGRRECPQERRRWQLCKLYPTGSGVQPS